MSHASIVKSIYLRYRLGCAPGLIHKPRVQAVAPSHSTPRKELGSPKMLVIASAESLEGVPIARRRLLGGAGGLLGLLSMTQPSEAGLFGLGGGQNALAKAFERALAVQDDPVALEQAWTECLAIAPNNAAILSNRGTTRLSLKKYGEAAEDLERARGLEVAAYGYSSGFVMVALGSAKGALGDYEGALECYEDAKQDPYPGMVSLALASSALAEFELGRDSVAVNSAREALAEVPEMQDMQAALAGMLWVTGNKAGAKESCDALGGEASLKTFVDAQQSANGWPPRTIAAVNAFLASENSGTAIDYSGVSKSYTF